MIDFKKQRIPRNATYRGFTIVELLIVIVVIGILASITIVAYSGIQQRARDAVQKTTLSSASKFASTYLVMNNELPSGDAIPTSKGVALTIGSSGTDRSFCITASGTGYVTKNVTHENMISDGPCEGQSGGASYCPDSALVVLNGYYCDGTVGSVATTNTNAVKLLASATGVPANAPAAYVGQQTSRDNFAGSTIAVNPGESYCFSGWATTQDSTVSHTIGVMITGPSMSTQWLGVPSVSAVTAKNVWIKLSGCRTIPSGYTSARFWSQNDGGVGGTANVSWYQTALTFSKN